MKAVKNKGGRPKFKINYEEVEKLSQLHCTIAEIASFLGCHPETLSRDKKFSELYKKGMDTGKMSLRRMQFKAASAGNVTMLIWLGKQLLGQTDKMNYSGLTTDETERLRQIAAQQMAEQI